MYEMARLVIKGSPAVMVDNNVGICLHHVISEIL